MLISFYHNFFFLVVFFPFFLFLICVFLSCFFPPFSLHRLRGFFSQTFLAEVGNACKVNLILQTIVGVSLVGLAEALALGMFIAT